MGLLYGLIVRLLIELDNSGSDFNLSIAFLFVTPAVMGAITPVAQNSDQQEEKVLLKLSCTYSISTKFNWYSKFWANWILDDFQEVILAVIKNRAEAQL